jgi:hypothetical protein
LAVPLRLIRQVPPQRREVASEFVRGDDDDAIRNRARVRADDAMSKRAADARAAVRAAEALLASALKEDYPPGAPITWKANNGHWQGGTVVIAPQLVLQATSRAARGGGMRLSTPAHLAAQPFLECR